MEFAYVEDLAKRLADEAEKIIIGKREQIEIMIMSIFSGGHILLDDLPGSGKTTLIKTLSIALGCDFKRVQFTPDLLPSDIIGMNIFDQKSASFRFLQGPINTNILLADEINRAIPRTQSALLEAMEEKQVTIDGESHILPKPFVVMATQNPVESESTFLLPAAQMDRFFIRLSMGYPSLRDEFDMLTNLGDGIPFEDIKTITNPVELIEIQGEIEKVHVSDHVKEYIVAIVHATRANPSLKVGASPRGSRSLFQGGKAWAAIKGRTFVTPDDIKEISGSVLCHRIMLTGEARFSGETTKKVIDKILEETPVPPSREAMVGRE